MAIHEKNGCRQLLVEALRYSGKPIADLVMVEFGNQRIKTDPGMGMRRLQSAKSVFEWFGVRHFSIDINGHNGAIKANLGRDLRQQAGTDSLPWDGADLVTNFGTTEHVKANRNPEAQYWCFANAHNLCEVGGIMVHAVPRTGTCQGEYRHGNWKYGRRWFRWLCTAAGYTALYLRECDVSKWWPPERIPPDTQIYVHAILEKTSSEPFIYLGEWKDPPRT